MTDCEAEICQETEDKHITYRQQITPQTLTRRGSA